jgi:hypothetical protein
VSAGPIGRSSRPAACLNVNRLGPVVWLQTFLTEL